MAINPVETSLTASNYLPRECSLQYQIYLVNYIPKGGAKVFTDSVGSLGGKAAAGSNYYEANNLTKRRVNLVAFIVYRYD